MDTPAPTYERGLYVRHWYAMAAMRTDQEGKGLQIRDILLTDYCKEGCFRPTKTAKIPRFRIGVYAELRKSIISPAGPCEMAYWLCSECIKDSFLAREILKGITLLAGFHSKRERGSRSTLVFTYVYVLMCVVPELSGTAMANYPIYGTPIV